MNDAAKKISVLVSLAAALAFAQPAYAEISVDAAFKGTLIITGPKGEIQVLQAGDAIPQIIPGSTIEIFDGTLTVKNGDSDDVTLSCLKTGVAVGGGGSATMTCGADSGTLTVIKNSVKFVNDTGIALEEGKDYPITGQAGQQTAPPTAALDNPDGTPVADNPPVDSRSIQSSASQ